MKYFKRLTLTVALTVCMMVFAGMALSTENGHVNINTATIEELSALDGIGEKYAQRIIEYREQNGEFKSPEDILNVKGIGEKTFEKNKTVIVTEHQE